MVGEGVLLEDSQHHQTQVCIHLFSWSGPRSVSREKKTEGRKTKMGHLEAEKKLNKLASSSTTHLALLFFRLFKATKQEHCTGV